MTKSKENKTSITGKRRTWQPAYNIIAIILLAVVGVSLVNMRYGQTLMGLDNYSPYFDLGVTMHRILTTDTFFNYGGLAFNWVSHLLVGIGFPSWIVSQVNVWLAFVLGVFGVLAILTKVISRQKSLAWNKLSGEKKIIILLGMACVFGSLVSIWLLNQPNLVFLAAFAGIPALIMFFLSDEELKSPWWSLYFLVGISYFFVTSLNLVAFGMYFIEAVLIAVALGVLLKKIDFKTILIRAGVVVVLWVVIVQVLLFFTPYKRLITSEVILHIGDIQVNEMTQTVTEDLRASELQNNSFVNVARYATGWMELHDEDGGLVFQYYDAYMNNPILIVLGLVLVIVVLVASSKVLKKYPQSKWLYILTVIALIVMSRYSIIVLGNIPLLGDGLRWVSSKLWPLLYFPLVVLFVISIQEIVRQYSVNVKYLLFGLIALGLLIYSFPWWTGSVVSSYARVELPSEYKVFERFDQDDRVLYLPMPQSSYFRHYEWGYFGSDFVSYMTKAEIVDGSSLNNYVTNLDGLERAFSSCEWDYLEYYGVNYVVYDTSVVGAYNETPSCAVSHRDYTGGSLSVFRISE